MEAIRKYTILVGNTHGGFRITVTTAEVACMTSVIKKNNTKCCIIEPRHEKTCLRGLRPDETQTDLLSYRNKLES